MASPHIDASPDPASDVDLTEQSRWRSLRLLLDAMDDEIARLYAERGVEGVRPRFAMPLIRLGRTGPMTVRRLATSVEVTHSAMSQTVAAMRREGLVETGPGADARTREVRLTDRGRELISFLEAEWCATECSLIELEAELPYPLSRVVDDIAAALDRRSFHDRIVAWLAEIEGHDGR